MELSSWLSVLTVCALAAMSPGPSIAIIIQITSKDGRQQGLLAAIGHGAGIGCYAILAAAGLAVIIQQSPLLFQGLKLVGALFLAFLGVNALELNIFKSSHSGKQAAAERIQRQPNQIPTTRPNSFILGFLTAFLNPKVAIFFLALFSQFIRQDSLFAEKMLMASTAAMVDTLWYLLVAIVASEQRVANNFSRYGKLLQRLFGVLLIALAIRIAWS